MSRCLYHSTLVDLWVLHSSGGVYTNAWTTCLALTSIQPVLAANWLGFYYGMYLLYQAITDHLVHQGCYLESPQALIQRPISQRITVRLIYAYEYRVLLYQCVGLSSVVYILYLTRRFSCIGVLCVTEHGQKIIVNCVCMRTYHC
jgi:hypothetical protein